MASRPRPLLRWLLRLFWLGAVLEVGAFVGVWALQGARPSYAAVGGQAAAVAGAELGAGTPSDGEQDTRSFQQVRHPYLGYVARPTDRREREQFSMLSSASMADPDSPLYDEDAVVIGLTGGSVAAGVFNSGGPALVKRLRAAPWLKGRKLHLFSFATAGFKQPQQAVGLAYLLAAGVRFDAVINLDGFNEVSLTHDAGLAQGGFPAYPYAWSSKVALSSDALALAGELAFHDRARGAAARALEDSPFAWSWVRKLAWVLKDRREASARESLVAQLAAHQADTLAGTLDPAASFERLGPRRSDSAAPALVTDLAAIWSRGARVMQSLCDGAGILYLGALQPNQYDPGFEKPMGPEEQRIALNEASKFAAPAREGYPVLRQEREALLEEGLDILDLRSLFATESEPRFRDDCCHFNPAGNAAVAEALAEALLARGLGQ